MLTKWRFVDRLSLDLASWDKQRIKYSAKSCLINNKIIIFGLKCILIILNIYMNAIKNDATGTIKGFLFQFYVAVEKCFELKDNEILYIEKYGDISIGKECQYEIKNYSDQLTDFHHNFWKTLKNWLDDNFDPTLYKNLVLLTTQQIHPNSIIRKWNAFNTAQRLRALNAIAEKYYSRPQEKSELTAKWIDFVLDKKHFNKLSIILEKFVISDSCPPALEYWTNIKCKYGKGIIPHYKDLFFDSLLGFIISPGVHNNGWSISCDDFTFRVRSLHAKYCQETIIFPVTYSNLNITAKDTEENKQHLFIQKIKEIRYIEEISNATRDYIRTMKTIDDDLKSHSIPPEHFDSYQQELETFYHREYRTAKRNIIEDKVIELSQTFYDNIMNSPIQNFHNFNNTPAFFRNGIFHIIADDNTRNLHWKL